ncbi:MAG: saccharopine dehydrogenase family protein [Polyangiales bacterium]
MAERTYDLVLFGATGFTGKLVAEAIAKRGKDLRWAIAGRNQQKLEAVRTSIGLPELPILIADANDPSALAEVAKSTRVVCTTVGPYARYGKPLVKACVEAGTDYCDLTGETTFVRASIDELEARAKETGARIVHCSGFDSIPSDLGVLALHDHFKSHGKQLARAKLFAGPVKGGFSGGTVHSMLGMVEQASTDASARRVLGDPYSLTPGFRGSDRGDQAMVRHDDEVGEWTAPFVMAAINTRVVRRSNMLLDFAYGKDFRYEEVMSLPRGMRGPLMGAAISCGMGAFMALGAIPVTRPLLARALPEPGEGPSEEARNTGFFKMRVFGWSAGETAPSAVCKIEGEGDPGYAATARMLAEVSRLLVETSKEGKRGGILTPASALGLSLIPRLREVGVRFDVS